MADIAALGVTVTSDGAVRATSDLDRLKRAAGGAETGTKGLGGEADRTSRRLDNMAGSADRLAKLLVRGFSALTTGLLARALVNAADSWTRLQNQVGAATRDMAHAADTMERMVEISRASFSTLDQTVQAFSSAAVTFRGMGRAADEAADFVESLNLHLVAGYVEGQQAASVTLALSRAMAVGTLRAQGLETVLGNSMEVAEALANELGVTVNELRGLAAQGKITGDVIANAMIGNLETMRDVVSEMPWSIGGAITALRLEFQVFAAAVNEGTGATAAMAQGVRKLADAFQAMSSWDWARIAERGVRLLAAAAVALTAVLAARLVRALAATTVASGGAGVAFTAQYYATVALTGATTALRRAVTLLGGPWGLLLAGAGALAAYFWDFGAATKETTHEMLNARDASGELSGALTRIEQGARLAREEMEGLTRAMLESRRAELLSDYGKAAVEAATQIRALQTEVLRGSALGPDVMRSRGSILNDLSTMSDDIISGAMTLQEALDRLDGYLTSPFAGAYDEMNGPGAFAGWVAAAQQALVSAQQLRDQFLNVDAAVREYGEEAVEITGRLTEETIAANDELEQMIANYGQRAEMARLENQYGKDSLAVLAARLEPQRLAVVAQVALSDATAETKQRTIEAYDAMVRAENMANVWAKAVENVKDWADNARAALEQMARSEPGAGWLDTAIAKAAALAGNLWDAAAGMLAAQGTGFTGPRPRARPRDIDFGVLPPSVGGGGGGGGGGGATIDQYAEQMQRLNDEIERNNVLIQHGELAAEIWQAQRDAGVEALSLQGQQIDATMRQIAAQEQQLSMIDQIKAKTDEWKSTIQDAFVGFVTGAKSFKQAVVDIIAKLAEMMAMKAFEVLWGGGIGGGIGGFIGKLFGFADGTSYAPGGMAWVGERGPELVSLPAGARVYNAQASRDMARQGQAGGTVRVIIEEAPGFATRVRAEAQGVAVQVVSAAARSQADSKYLSGAA